MSDYRSPAILRYLRRLAFFMVLFAVLIFAMGWLFRHDPPAAPWSAMLAILPALPVLGVIWSVMRLLREEEDEYWRMLFVRQALIATGFCLTIMTIWEFLQNYRIVSPGQHGFGAAFLWFVGLGLGAIWNGLDLRRQQQTGES